MNAGSLIRLLCYGNGENMDKHFETAELQLSN